MLTSLAFQVSNRSNIVIVLDLGNSVSLAPLESVGASSYGAADLPIEQQISVAGEGLARVGEIVGLRAESYFQEINYLFHPEQEPVMALDVFDRWWRRSMMKSRSHRLLWLMMRILVVGVRGLGIVWWRVGFWSIVEVTGLAPVEVLLGLLVGGLSIRWGIEAGQTHQKLYLITNESV